MIWMMSRIVMAQEFCFPASSEGKGKDEGIGFRAVGEDSNKHLVPWHST